MTDDQQQPKFIGHYHGDGFEPCADPDCEVAARARRLLARYTPHWAERSHADGACKKAGRL